jgi:hypothetical protein
MEMEKADTCLTHCTYDNASRKPDGCIQQMLSPPGSVRQEGRSNKAISSFRVAGGRSIDAWPA